MCQSYQGTTDNITFVYCNIWCAKRTEEEEQGSIRITGNKVTWHIRIVDLGYFKNLKEPTVFMKEPMVLFDFFEFMRIVIMHQK
jgi:hypothetical protein